jgi:outer membrane protein assembly factor BamB
MGTRITRRRFLTAAGYSAAYLALANTVGCEPTERSSKAKPTMSSHPTQSEGAVAYGLQPAPQHGAWAFHSRPDLSPPALEVAKKAYETAPGYIFVAPQQGRAWQGGSLVIDDRGQVVWFRPLPGTSERVMDFKVQRYRGKPVLTWVETPGQYVIFDDSYREIARFGAANGYRGDHHEFLISPQDTALITIFNHVPADLSLFGGREDGVAVQGIVQELDIQTGKVIFEWHSLDHVALDETYGKLGEAYSGTALDYFHINSIDVDHDDNLLVSARKTFAVYKIDRNSGQIIWRLGGKKSDFQMGPGARFAYQHDARRLPDGTISIFDNGTTVFENSFPKAVEESRAIVLKLDERKMMASLVREYTNGRQADAAGNAQVLPNGNVFVGWGRARSFSEFSRDGKLLFDAKLQRNNSYRVFRFPWSARPTDRPAAAAERTSEEEVRLYASWNGATDVASWEVLAGGDQSRLGPLVQVPRNGFETTMEVQTSKPYVAVRAKDRLGQTLCTTAPIKL